MRTEEPKLKKFVEKWNKRNEKIERRSDNPLLQKEDSCGASHLFSPKDTSVSFSPPQLSAQDLLDEVQE